MSDTPLTDAAERSVSRKYDRAGEYNVPGFQSDAVAELARKLERQISAIKSLPVYVHDFGRIGTVGGGELMIAGERYVKAAELRAILKS